jgi:hypothetical protein
MSRKTDTPKEQKKKSTVRHTRAVQRDRSKRQTVAPPDEQIAAHLMDIVHPATWNQMELFRALGLRSRILTLPVMMAFVLSLVWRGIGSVCEAVRVLNREGMLWTSPVTVTQQAVEQRLNELPAKLFHAVLQDILPKMQQRWEERTRPLSEELAWAKQHFTDVVAVDGSTLDGVLRKCGLLQNRDGPVLAGRIASVLDVVSKLPRDIWYEEDSQAHDQRFWERILTSLRKGMLVIFDLGFVNYARFDELTDKGIGMISRIKSNATYHVQQVLHASDTMRDELIRLGSGSSACTHPMRLVSVRWHGIWYRYVTNVTDPTRLPPGYVAALYWQRWRIEDAFNVVKRLLGLAYFWAGSINAIQVQVWATWIVYAVLVDLTDAVAELLRQPFAALSMEMGYRGLYHFTQAYHRGEAHDPVAYLAAEAQGLGILKRKRASAKEEFLKNLTNHSFP